MHQIIVFAIPIFAVLIAAEFAYGLTQSRNTYRLNDAISSLSQGLLSQTVAVCTPLLQIGIYAWVQPHVAWHGAEAFWNTWIGWLLAVLLYDLCDYWLHRVGHERAIFWAAHVVHHQSQHFNLSTALRQESAYGLLGWIFYLPMAVIGVPAEVFGMAALVVLIYQFWIHTEHIGKLGWFDRVFSSPSNHRVHHAVNDRYLNKNYGAILVVWDRLFGTFEEERESEPCVYGTRAPLKSWNPLWAVAEVYSSLLGQAWRTRKWADKLRLLWNPPGWQPADLALTEPLRPFILADVERFDTEAGKAQRTIACLLFVMVLAGLSVLLWRADELGATALGVAAAGTAAGLWVIGKLVSGGIGASKGGLIGLLATGVSIGTSAGWL